jgi:hypothetical protein
MSYVIYRFVQGVKMYLGYTDWELSKEEAILLNGFQAEAIVCGFEDCEKEVVR